MMNKLIISQKGEVVLLYPFNEWDMNYHILDNENNKHYFIDITDVGEEEFEELKELDLYFIEEYSWKTTEITY